MGKHQKTHPWISFQLDFRRATPELWLALGEACSKCEHIAKVPLRPSTALHLHQLYLAKGAAATTAIEGNTLSEEEVMKAVEGKLNVPPSKEYLKQEVENIIAACNTITDQIAAASLPELATDLICSYNTQVLRELPESSDGKPGILRTHSVLVGSVYRGAPAEECDVLLHKLCDWLNGPDFHATEDKDLAKMKVVYAIIKAIIAHLYLAWIHPFSDGNGRTARLMEFHILLSAGVPSPAAHLLSNHYNQTRSEYYRQLDYASKSGGDVMPFLAYAVQGLVDGLRAQVEYIWEQQWDIVWRNYVHEQFRQQNSKSDVRQRHLALDLSLRGDWVAIGDVIELTTRLAKAYASKTSKTVQRDLNKLEEMGLIVREGKRVRARREIILSFLPLSGVPPQPKAE